MNGNDEIIELLNEVLTGELTAINQYFVDAKMASNWGYERLGKHFRDESIDEMKDADKLIERILYLEGVPNLQRLGRVRVGETVAEKLAARAGPRARGDRAPQPMGSPLCVDEGDNGTRDLLEDILEGEEEHADWLETQLVAGRPGRRAALPRRTDARLMTDYQTPEWHPAFEEYGETIFELGEDDVDIIQARIAERLHVSRPAVSEMVKRMQAEGLVAHEGHHHHAHRGRHSGWPNGSCAGTGWPSGSSRMSSACRRRRRTPRPAAGNT